jgi:hypothetical protein
VFTDVPTDADYAMELISQRVASGLNIKPSPMKKHKKPNSRNIETGGDASIKSYTEKKSIDWKKWGNRAALGKVLAGDGKRLFAGGEVRKYSLNCLEFEILTRMFSGSRRVHGHRAIHLHLNQYYWTAYPAHISRPIVCHPRPSSILLTS